MFRANVCFSALERTFRVQWGIKFKPSSCQYMLPRGSVDADDMPSHFSRVSEMGVLGHLIADDCSIKKDWQILRASMWKAFWGNSCSSCLEHDSVQKRIMLLSRAVTSVANFRFSRWPCQKTIALELDNVQVKMTAALHKSPERVEKISMCFLGAGGGRLPSCLLNLENGAKCDTILF